LFTIFLVVQMVVIFVDVVQCPLFLACRQFFPFATGPADVYLGMLGDVMKLFPEDAEVLSHPSHRRCLLLPRGCFRTGIASKEIIIGDTDVHHVGVGHPLHDAGESMDIDDILVEAHRLLEGLEDESGVADHLRSIDRLMDDTLAEVEQRMEHGCNGITGIPTGFDALDHVTAGWQRGDLNILAARPSVGKTAFALHLARAAAMAGRHVVVFSLEMQGERLGDRWLLAATEEVDPQHLRSGQLTPGEVRQVHEASAELSRLPILIDDHPMTSMDRVRSSARLLKSKNRCDMVIVDYLQLCDMRSDQKNRNREQEVAQASRKAKLLAKELDIPVLLLSQLNRASDGTIDHRPTLSNLRESGAIEQDADMVMLLCRPALYGKTVDKKSTYPTDGLGIVIIAKHRNGKTGEVYFHHNQSMTKLVDYIPPLEWLTRNAK
jgi:replicative DNA helicase